MAANGKQKLKLLYLYKMLSEDTDSERGLTMTQIIQRLADEGVSAERKGIYRDIKVLRQFGLDIVTIPHYPVEYALRKDGLSLAELTLLVDAVQGSKFLTQRTSGRLVASIRNLASPRERDLLDKRVHVDGRVKSQNDSVFHNVDTIHEAMRLKRKVRFLYFKYDAQLQRQIQHGGDPYEHTPVQVVFSDGFYYLVTYSDRHDGFVRFRIDRMRLVQVSEKPATRNPRIANYRYDEASGCSFGMFGGKAVTAKLRVAPGAMDIIVDRFGLDLAPAVRRDGAADVSVKVLKSPQFFAWVAGTDGAVTIAGPKGLKEEYRAWLLKLAD